MTQPASIAPALSPDLSIVILTYDRPDSLELTLRSCLAQTNALNLSREIVIVDNHPSGNGKATADRIAAEAPFPVRYVTDLSRNMSTLRNRAFSEARAPLAALIDDDEVAKADWTDELVGALRTSGADIAVGPRLATFASGAPPAYDPTGSQFTRDLHLPDGAEIVLTTAAGKPRYGLGTGNSLFNLRTCFPDGEPAMREAFGDAGGEDAELFARLHREGRKLVWAGKAFVTETVLPHRTEIAYRLLRTRRETQHYVSIYIDGARSKPAAWFILMLKGWAQLIAGFLIAAVTFEFGSRRRLRGRLLMAHGAGKLSWRQAIGYISEPSATI